MLVGLVLSQRVTPWHAPSLSCRILIALEWEKKDIKSKNIPPAISNFKKLTKLEIKGESESLGGLLLEINNKIPSKGDKINFDNFVFTIMSVDKKRIRRVRVYKKSDSN